jgi:hypothetical protein
VLPTTLWRNLIEFRLLPRKSSVGAPLVIFPGSHPLDSFTIIILAPNIGTYNVVFPAAFAFAHLALADAASFFLAAALMMRFDLALLFEDFFLRYVAHLFLAASAIALRPTADICRLPADLPGGLPRLLPLPSLAMESSWDSSFSIC